MGAHSMETADLAVELQGNLELCCLKCVLQNLNDGPVMTAR